MTLLSRYPDVVMGQARTIVVEIDRDTAWPAGASAWTWTLTVDDERDASGTPEISKAAGMAVIGDDSEGNTDCRITLTFSLAATDTNGSGVSPGRKVGEVKSKDGESDAVPWPCTRKPLNVLRPLGSA